MQHIDEIWERLEQRLREYDAVLWSLGDVLVELADRGHPAEDASDRMRMKSSLTAPRFRDLKRAAELVPASERGKLPWSFVREVSDLPDDARKKYLDEAARERWTVVELRRAKAGRRPESTKKKRAKVFCIASTAQTAKRVFRQGTDSEKEAMVGYLVELCHLAKVTPEMLKAKL